MSLHSLQNPCETEVIPQKPFLKYREGTARLAKNKATIGKEPTRLFRRVSFDFPNHLSLRAQWKTGKPGKRPQLKRPVSSPPVLCMEDKTTNCIAFSSDRRCQIRNNGQRVGEREGGGGDGNGYGSDEMMNKNEPTLSSPLNWSGWPKECNKQINEETKVVDKNEAQRPGSQEPSGWTDKRSNKDSQVPVNLMEVHVMHLAGKQPNASRDASDLQPLERTESNQVDQSSRLQLPPGMNGIKQGKNEHPESEVEIHLGFKKVNDRIIKVTAKPDRKHMMMTTAHSQREHRNCASAANGWKGKTLSRESACTSTDSEDELKSYCSQYPLKPNIQRATKTDRKLDLSDADYATDESSGAEDFSLTTHGKLPPKTSGSQGLPGQQEASLITISSSESSTGAGSLEDKKVLSPVRRSPFHSARIRRREKHPESRRVNNTPVNSSEFSLQPPSLTSDLVASLFPVFKTKTSLDDEKSMLGKSHSKVNGKLTFTLPS